MTHTTYVLDTNVLLYDPDSLLSYPQAEIVIPIDVIEEIDQFKKVLAETGHNARAILKRLDDYRQHGSLSEGVTLPNDGRLRVAFFNPEDYPLPQRLDYKKCSNRVLGLALYLKQNDPNIVLVTHDTNLRVKANAFGLATVHYERESRDEHAYKGLQRKTVDAKTLATFKQQEHFSFEGQYYPQEGMLLISEDDPDESVLGRWNVKQECFEVIPSVNAVWGIQPRNFEQKLAIDLLLDPDISVVTLVGKAGTGKTLLALAVGLEMMLIQNRYAKLLVSRPIFPMGKDLGYLPGDVNEKLAPWMQPIFDNLELLIDAPMSKNAPTVKGYQELIQKGLLAIEPLTYIRGRSIPRQYMIVDEAQNLTPHEIKTIITRAGQDTKIILTGDPYQIDNPYVDFLSNGLSYIVEKFKHHHLAGHVILKQGERSALAELGANIL